MIAKDSGRTIHGIVLGFAAVGLLTPASLQAQQAKRGGLFGGAKAQAQTPAKDEQQPDSAEPQKLKQPVRMDDLDVPPLNKMVAIPVNPTDPIAIVNNQIITRQQLADECVARKGKEVLETMINRKIVDQALKALKKEITAAEIDTEIDSVARRFGIGREAWLRTLDKERGISPLQYAHDIIYPALALRKLTEGKVQVTPKDLQDAFESQYGDKLRCRMIMVDSLAKAQDVWERIRKNPGGFEKIAQTESLDTGTRSLGGQMADPITRHATPITVSDAAFTQLVDGDKNDKDPDHKPKDGDFTGPIQAAEGYWVILRREGVIPATPNASLENAQIKDQIHQMIFEVRQKEMMGVIFQNLVNASSIDNKLVGTIKMANETPEPEDAPPGTNRDAFVNGTTDNQAVRTGAQAPAGKATKLPTPSAAPNDVVEEFKKLQKQPPLKTTNQAAPQAAQAPATAPK